MDLASSAAFDALVQVVMHRFQVLQDFAVLVRGVFEVLDLADPLGKGLKGVAVVLDLVCLCKRSCQKKNISHIRSHNPAAGAKALAHLQVSLS